MQINENEIRKIYVPVLYHSSSSYDVLKALWERDPALDLDLYLVSQKLLQFMHKQHFKLFHSIYFTPVHQHSPAA